MSEQQLYDKNNPVDRITFLALYMPIVRTEVEKYVELWNLHAIRKQPKRPNAVIGKPKVNYLYPKDGTIHYGRPVITEITDGVNQEFQDWG